MIVKATVAYVRNAFPALDEYPDERIELLVRSGDDTDWVRILDDAWEGFQNEPPKRMIVQIVDRPGEAKTSRSTISFHYPLYRFQIMLGKTVKLEIVV